MAEYRLTLSFSSSEPLHRERLAVGLAALIAGFGLVLRFYQLGSESLWVDEALTNVFSRNSLASLWNPSGEADLTPPLWYTLQKAWLIFGDSEAALRSPAALAGVLAVPVVFVIGKLTAGNRAGLLASLLQATSVVHVHFSQEARTYALLFLSAAITVWGLIYILADPNRAMSAFRRDGADSDLRRIARLAWAAYGFGAMIALYSHNTAVFLLVWANICWLIVWLRTGRAPAFLVAWLGVNVAVALSFAWWLPIVIHQSVETLATGSFGKQYTSWPVLVDLMVSVYGVRHLGGAGGATAIAAIVLAGVGSWRLRHNLPALLVLAGVVVFVPIATTIFGFWRQILGDRVLLWPIAALMVLVAIGILGLPRWAAILIGSVLIGLNLIGLANYYDDPVKPNWREVATFTRNAVNSTDAFVVWPAYERVPINYYYQRVRDGTKSPPTSFGVWPPKLGQTGPPRLVEGWKNTEISFSELGRRYQRIWLVTASWPNQVGAVRARFEPLGNIEEVRRIGNIWIFRIDVTPPSPQ